MLSAFTAFVMALAIVVVLTPFVRRLAARAGALDAPGDARRVHEHAVPRMGGLALVAGFFAPLAILFAVETEVARIFFSEPLRALGLASGSLVLAAVGVVDDIRGVRAIRKLAAQIVAGCLAYACGFRIAALSVPLFGHLDMGAFALPVTVLWIVAIVNAINLIDGLDGLAGGVAFFACVVNFVVGSMNGDVLVMLLSAALGGAVLGFLLFNFNPASIFMGDTGSLFLGYVLATTSIQGNYVKSSTAVAILVPLIALGLPIMDTLFAMVRRYLEHRPIFSPDRGHIHHRLLAMGINHRRAVLLLYGLSVLFASGAILIAMGRRWQIGAALLVLSIAVIGVVRALDNFQLSMRRFRRSVPNAAAPSLRLRRIVLRTLRRIAETASVDEVPNVLVELGRDGQLEFVDLLGSEHPRVPDFSWPEGSPSDIDARYVVFLLPTLGPQARLRVGWPAEAHADLDAETLFQLLADALDERIRLDDPKADSQRAASTRSTTPA